MTPTRATTARCARRADAGDPARRRRRNAHGRDGRCREHSTAGGEAFVGRRAVSRLRGTPDVGRALLRGLPLRLRRAQGGPSARGTSAGCCCRPVPPPAASTPPVVAPTPTSARWRLVITVDSSLDTEPDPAQPPPANEPQRSFAVEQDEMLIGRRDDRQQIRPAVARCTRPGSLAASREGAPQRRRLGVPATTWAPRTARSSTARTWCRAPFDRSARATRSPSGAGRASASRPSSERAARVEHAAATACPSRGDAGRHGAPLSPRAPIPPGGPRFARQDRPRHGAKHRRG